jgi:hypothetical protein
MGLNIQYHKELAELLGLCWHEFWSEDFDQLDHWGKCKHCHKAAGDVLPNPDFTSSDGKIELLRLMMKRKDKDDFLKHLLMWDEYDPVIYVGSVEDYIIEPILDTTGRLAQAAVDYLRREKV